MDRRPLLWFAVSFVFGSSAAAGLSPSGAVMAVGAMTAVSLILVLCRQATWQLAAVCCLGCALAAGERMWADARNVTALPGLLAAAEADGARASYEAEVQGTIVSAVEVDGDRAMFRVAAKAVRVHGEERKLRERFLVHIRLEQQPEQDIAAAWQRGDQVRLAGELTLPAAASNSGGFDYRRYLHSQRIHWLFKATGTGAVEAAPGPKWTAAALLGRFDAARSWLGAHFDTMYPSNQSGYMKGLVLGIREDLDPEQFQQFSRLGLTHILAISGLHVGVFLYVLGAVLRFLRLTRERMLVTLMIAVPFYVILSGGSPSVVRAGMMAVLGLAAARMDKLKDGLHLLAAAAVLMLAWNPFFIEDVSFQLSYICTAGLILGVPPLRRAMPAWRRGAALLDLLAVTLVAQAASFPVSIYYFNQFHLLSVLANFILVPFISFIIMPIGAIALVISSMWPLGGKLLAIASVYANDWTFVLVEKLAQADGLRSIWATPPLWWIAAWYVLCAAICRLLPAKPALLETDPSTDDETLPLGTNAPKQSSGIREAGWRSAARPPLNRKGLLFAAGAALMLLLYAYFPDFADRAGRVHVLDVGQGDAIYVRTPGGQHLLIDGGGTLSFRKSGEEWKNRSDPFEVGRKVIAPLLMKRGVHEIDLLVISHLDSDHIRGLKAIMETIPVKAILWNGSLKEESDALALLRQAVAADIPLYGAKAGQQWSMDANSELTVLWPPAASNEATAASIPEIKDQNPASVVIHMRMYEHTFLFAGDIDAATEHAINELWLRDPSSEAPSSLLCCQHADVLKIAHHGSRFSSSDEWLSGWKPYSAAISVGASNSYGHPHPDVLKRLASQTVEPLRTDIDGEISYMVKPKGMYVRTVNGNKQMGQ